MENFRNPRIIYITFTKNNNAYFVFVIEAFQKNDSKQITGEYVLSMRTCSVKGYISAMVIIYSGSTKQKANTD